MNLRTTFAALLFSTAALAYAEVEELDLAGTLLRARSHAREVTAARARTEAVSQQARSAKAYRLPRLSLQEIWIRTDSPAGAFGLLLNQERFSLAEFSTGDPNNPQTTDNALTRLELSFPLYTGGEISSRIRQAELAAEATRDSSARIEDEAALAAAAAYIQLAQAREFVALLQSSLETVQAHVQLAQAYVDQGMLVRSELLRAEVERSRIEDLLSQARGQARVAETNLSFRLATDASSRWQIEPLTDPRPLDESLAIWLADADSRRDLAAASRMLEAGELEVKVKRSGLLPKVGLVARRDWNDDQLFGASGDSTAIMAVAEFDLLGGGRRHAAAAAAAARLEADAGRSELDHFRAGIQLAVRSAYEQASNSRERHETALAAQEAARELERITQERFKKGVVKTIDLLDAATALREAETRELVARAEAHLAILKLAVQAGRRPESALP